MTVVSVRFLKFLVIHIIVLKRRFRKKFNAVLKIKLNSYNVCSFNFFKMDFYLKFNCIDNHLLFIPNFFHSIKIINILEDN